MKNVLSISAALAAATCGMGMSTDANAEIVRHNATGICQGALPAFDTQIRKRPLAVRNEGTANSFVSCSLPGSNGVAHNSTEIVFTNSSAVAVQVNCTVVTGRAVFSSAPVYYSRVLDLDAEASLSIVQTFDNLVDQANLINSSCLLPPGVSLDYIRYDSVDPL